jgi:23S rRNA (pseudouridine1915-N3)-methyltransferase
VKLVVVRARAPRTRWADEAVADYGRRIQRYLPFEERLGEPRPERRDRLVVLDPRGRDLSSEGWAELVERATLDGVRELVFALGGADGHPAGLCEAAHSVVRLGPMVMNHAVARVVVVEQLYRACAIRAGSPYHHG